MRKINTKYTLRTDLATEARAFAASKIKKPSVLDGVETHSSTQNGITVETLLITSEEGSRLCGKPKGKYVTLDVGHIHNATREQFENAANLISSTMRGFFPREGSCLLCAMGNRDITADALGPVCAESFIVTRHIKYSDKKLFDSLGLRETMCIVPGVTAKTGYEGAQSIIGLVQSLKPDFAVVVDALASRKLSRLATTVQICDTGLCPGSGVGNTRKAINAETLGIPVFAVGVPTVVEASTLALDILEDAHSKSAAPFDSDSAQALLSQNPTYFFVTPKDTDHIIKDISKLIGFSLNLALHNDMTVSECEEFLS